VAANGHFEAVLRHVLLARHDDHVLRLAAGLRLDLVDRLFCDAEDPHDVLGQRRPGAVVAELGRGGVHDQMTEAVEEQHAFGVIRDDELESSRQAELCVPAVAFDFRGDAGESNLELPFDDEGEVHGRWQ